MRVIVGLVVEVGDAGGNRLVAEGALSKGLAAEQGDGGHTGDARSEGVARVHEDFRGAFSLEDRPSTGSDHGGDA